MKEGIWAYSLKGYKVPWEECEVAGHMVSSVEKQREMDVGVVYSSILFSPGMQPTIPTVFVPFAVDPH